MGLACRLLPWLEGNIGRYCESYDVNSVGFLHRRLQEVFASTYKGQIANWLVITSPEEELNIHNASGI